VHCDKFYKVIHLVPLRLKKVAAKPRIAFLPILIDRVCGALEVVQPERQHQWMHVRFFDIVRPTIHTTSWRLVCVPVKEGQEAPQRRTKFLVDTSALS